MDIAIISGASSGIGKEIARLLDDYGYDELWLISSNEEKLLNSSKDLKTKCRIFPLDLTKFESYTTLESVLKEENPNVKYLVSSAGVGYNGNFDGISTDEIGKMVDINVRALTAITSISLPYINKGGRILQIASGAGFVPQPGFSVYAATKSYVISFSRVLRQELRKRKISVTTACPGPVDTPFFSGLENVKEYKKKYLISPEKVAKGVIKASKRKRALYVPTIPMKLVHVASKFIPKSLILKFYK